MMWRVLSSPKAGDKGYHCGILGEDLFWSRGNRIDEVQQEQWRSVLVDRPGFEALLRELAVLSPVQKVTAGETAEWIAAYPGSNSKEGWAAYKRHYGARAAKRDEVFQPMWREIHGEPSRGRPRKSPNDQ
ncbi:hypothetical protein [Sphingopyxis flava]|nr:hypothetical protein [Sphingopyxis flava]